MKDIVEKRTINRGIRNWIIDCPMYYSSRIYEAIAKRRDNKIWIFSTWEGTKYSDSSRYLFEFANKNLPDIRCVWITKIQTVYDEVKNMGYEVYLSNSREGEIIEKKAGVAICTHGIDDFGEHPQMLSAHIVCLWHGIVGMKQALATRSLHDNRLLDFIANIKARVFSYTFSDLMVSTSEFDEKILRDQLLAHKDVVMVGLPRNDVFKHEDISLYDVFNDSLLEKYDIRYGQRLIVYMPTYRGAIEGQKRLERIIAELTQNSTLNEYFSKSNTKLLMKMHYLTDTSNMVFSENIICLDDADVKCTQKLLSLCDTLITDYSSCAADFALTNRHIIFFAPDYMEYDLENGLTEEFKKILNKYKITSIHELVKEIQSGSEMCSKEVNQDLNALFNEKASECGKYCDLVASEIIKKYVKSGRRFKK